MLTPTAILIPSEGLSKSDVFQRLKPVLNDGVDTPEDVQEYARKVIRRSMHRAGCDSGRLAEYILAEKSYVTDIMDKNKPVTYFFISLASFPLSLTINRVMPVKRGLPLDNYNDARAQVIGRRREYGSEWDSRSQRLDLDNSICLLLLDACFPREEPSQIRAKRNYRKR